jgi:hypothetical protein
MLPHLTIPKTSLDGNIEMCNDAPIVFLRLSAMYESKPQHAYVQTPCLCGTSSYQASLA